MKILRGIFFAFFACAAALNTSGANAKNVYVAANKNSAGSVKLAKEYCALRSIPAENIIFLDTSQGANISRENYDTKIASPIFEFLKSRGAIKDIFNAPDPKRAMVVKTDIDFLVLCKGVPFRISEQKPEKKPSAAANNSACVDSELALLFKGSYELKGMQKNPLFGTGREMGDYKKQNYLAVSRLDGITCADALNLAKSAARAEEAGLRGRGYIDMSQKYPAGDKWLAGTKAIIEELGFDVSADTSPHLMNYFCRFDAPAFYFGWYTHTPRYYTAACRYADGASTLHIYSFSAITLSRKTDWTPSFAAQNSAAAFGYIDEPFLHATHRPDIYMHYISRGFSAAEAAFYSMPFFSWKGILLADPLYTPLKKPLDLQLADIESGKADEYSQYAVIRKINLTLRGNAGAQAAAQLAQKYLKKLPAKFALHWRLAQICADTDPEKSAALARLAAQEASKDFQNFGLVFEIADFLKKQNMAEESAQICLQILNSAQSKDFLQNTIPALLRREKFTDEEKAALQARLKSLQEK
ncbi:MAG: TIGR03790 family protein [Opitutales bacterium]|nr:TIGR03790 family protein [Opitutales bacterium]